MITNPLESIHNCIAFGDVNWTKDKKHIWIYGIVCGWDDPSYTILMSKHGWTHDEVLRNKKMHKNFTILRKNFETMEKQDGILCNRID